MNEHVVFMLQLIITGIAVGGVYSLMALGFVLIFKASSVVNFGPGELVLFGAYVAWATILHMKLPLYVALPLTLVVAIVLGLVIERGVLRPLIGEPIISVIMVTFGVASVIRGFLNMTWGSDTRPFPVLFSQQPIPPRAGAGVAGAPVELRGGDGPARGLLGVLQILDHRDGDAGDGRQPAGRAVARGEREVDLRAVVVHRHRGVDARRHHPRQRPRRRRFLPGRSRAEGLPRRDPRGARQRAGRHHRRRADRRAREPGRAGTWTPSWAAG